MIIIIIQEELIDEFLLFDDWMDKYEYFIGFGKFLLFIDFFLKIDDKFIKGC